MRALIVGAAMMVAGTAAAESLTLTTEDYPPFNFEQAGAVSGLSTEIVQEIMHRSAIDATIALLPWSRAYDQALHTPGTCVYSTTVTDERKPLFKWVEPIVTNNWVLFAAAGSRAPAPKSLDEVKGKRIGGYLGDATALWLKAEGYVVDEAQRDDVNPKKLEAGRIDYWASGERLAPIMAKQAGVEIKPVLTIHQTVLGLACNETTPAPVIAKLNAALAAARDDGTLGKIEAKYR